MALPIVDIAEYLEDEGIGTVGTNIFPGSLPTSPDVCWCVRPAGGQEDQFGFGVDTIKEERPAIQILARATLHDHQTALTNAYAARAKVAKIQAETVNGTFWHFCRPAHPPFLLKEDDQDQRPVYSFVCFTEKEPSA